MTDIRLKYIKEKLLNNITINQKTNCWEWNRKKSKDGYGRLKLYNFRHYKIKNWSAHRLSYAVFVDDIPEGLLVCHHCDNPPCINPDHLFIGTHKDNMDDMRRKGKFNATGKLGNNYSGKRVVAGWKIYPSYLAAGRALCISDNGVRKRIKTNKAGYFQID